MSEEDYETMIDLAQHMTRVEAAKFIRSEYGCTLTEALPHARRGARPGSVLLNSFEAYDRFVAANPIFPLPSDQGIGR
jgi:hypothetical protein